MQLGAWREAVGRKGWHSSGEGSGGGRWRKMAGRRVVHPLPLATIDPRGWWAQWTIDPGGWGAQWTIDPRGWGSSVDILSTQVHMNQQYNHCGYTCRLLFHDIVWVLNLVL